MIAIRLLRLWLLAALGSVRRSAKYTYWVQPCTDPRVHVPARRSATGPVGVRSLAEGLGGALEFTRVKDREHARIRLYWASAEQGMYGETRPMAFEGPSGRGGLCAAVSAARNGDRLLRDAIVYLTCLHESGHALGLAHTAVFDDIMYSFQYGGDIQRVLRPLSKEAGNARRHREEFGDVAADRARLIAILKN
jgi:hypothetical protein